VTKSYIDPVTHDIKFKAFGQSDDQFEIEYLRQLVIYHEQEIKLLRKELAYETKIVNKLTKRLIKRGEIKKE
jgi:DNA-binding MarR family transcriptional regulator